jgi:hypothetical protein
MIWIHTQPSPTLPFSKLSLFLSLPVSRRPSLLTGVGRMGRARSQILRPRESLALYKSVNTFWVRRGKTPLPCNWSFFQLFAIHFFMHLENLLVDPLLLLQVPAGHLLQLQPIIQPCEILVDKEDQKYSWNLMMNLWRSSLNIYLCVVVFKTVRNYSL